MAIRTGVVFERQNYSLLPMSMHTGQNELDASVHYCCLPGELARPVGAGNYYDFMIMVMMQPLAMLPWPRCPMTTEA